MKFEFGKGHHWESSHTVVSHEHGQIDAQEDKKTMYEYDAHPTILDGLSKYSEDKTDTKSDSGSKSLAVDGIDNAGDSN